jgi:Cyclic nucleotide-binding domain
VSVHKTRVTAAAWSISWIPSESVSGALRRGFDVGLTHYDDPPADEIKGGVDEVRRLRDQDAFRFANVVGAWANVEDGRIMASGLTADAGVLMGSTRVRLARLGATFCGFSMPVLRPDPVLAEDGTSVTFVQTVGGRTGAPLPRPVPHPPFVQWTAPIVWTTVSLTLHADRRQADARLIDASPFPRHWLYGPDGVLKAKSGLTDQATWVTHSFGRRTPWGEHNSTALVADAESQLERQMSRDLMSGEKRPQIRRLPAGTVVTRQGEPGNELFLLLDGMLSVEIDGDKVTEVGPGAVLGELAVLEGGKRTATLVATTPIRLAVATADAVDTDRLRALADLHRGEEPSRRASG